MVPLFMAFLVGCTASTNYNPINTVKYAADKLNTTYEQLPNKAYYVTGKVLYNTTFDAIKADFPTYLPEEFTLKTDWYEEIMNDGITNSWNVLYENSQTKAEGELYYRDGGPGIQLWIVTYPSNLE